MTMTCRVAEQWPQEPVRVNRDPLDPVGGEEQSDFSVLSWWLVLEYQPEEIVSTSRKRGKTYLQRGGGSLMCRFLVAAAAELQANPI